MMSGGLATIPVRLPGYVLYLGYPLPLVKYKSGYNVTDIYPDCHGRENVLIDMKNYGYMGA